MNGAISLIQNELRIRRERNASYSLRSFAKGLGVSPAQLSQIISGKRPLTQKAAKAIAEKLQLSPTTKLRFLSDASEILSEALDLDREKKAQLDLEEDCFRMISDWYHLAILSLTRVKGARPDPRWVAARLGIKVDVANEAMTRLERLGILSLRPKFAQISDPISVLPTGSSSAVRNYHAQNLALAMDRLERVPKEKRNFQSITFAGDSRRIAEFAALADRFLTEASECVERGRAEEVYTLSVQLFPLTLNKEETP